MSDFFPEDDDRLASPVTGKPSVLRHVGYSSDEIPFLSKEDQSVVRGVPSGYDSAQVAKLIRDLLAARDETADVREAIIAQVESDRAAENAVPEPQLVNPPALPYGF